MKNTPSASQGAPQRWTWSSTAKRNSSPCSTTRGRWRWRSSRPSWNPGPEPAGLSCPASGPGIEDELLHHGP
ncbi:hypothetical protein AB4Y67_04770 [Arthrobacter sp. YAF17]|uniref:hypothetical protein n=1 Tax=Arthrobacter sp. YAF17 TaxID=3233077 RepID=UPI003F9254D0